jgi:hypothetical protein
MTEAEWLKCTDPGAMFEPLVAARGTPSGRKLRLFLAACHRRVWNVFSSPDREVLQAIEQYADGLITFAEMDAVYLKASYGDVHAPADEEWEPEGLWYDALAVSEQVGDMQGEQVAQVAVVRELFGNPFRPVTADPAWRSWDGGALARLAQAAYDDRQLPQGALNPTRLAVLADALEDAGCTDAAMLSHLRGPGPHVRGCWAVDLILGKE